MKNLLRTAGNIHSAADNPIKIVLLDFDGTIAPIVQSPWEAVLPKKTKKILEELTKKKDVFLGIISGRKLDDLKKKVGLSNIIYVGNHGLEGEYYGKKYEHPLSKKTKTAISKIKNKFDALTEEYGDTYVEDKGLTVGFHYRKLKKEKISLINSSVYKILHPFIAKGLISFVKGKKVWDVRPKAHWDKGHSASFIIEKISAIKKTTPMVIFIGDDATDEDAFRALKKHITIKVGKHSKTEAKYGLKDTREVFEFLKWLCCL